MTTFLLIRHGNNDFVGNTIVGRRPGVHLNAEGHAQAQALVERLAGLPITALYSSPLERAQETAAPLAERLDLPVRICEEIHEIDPGDWAGMTLDELRRLPEWDTYNVYRTGNRCPNGELVIDVQARFVTALETLRFEHEGEVVALFGHADPIRIALAYYIGMPLDHLLRLEISPASVNVLTLADSGPRVVTLNNTGGLTLG